MAAFRWYISITIVLALFQSACSEAPRLGAVTPITEESAQLKLPETGKIFSSTYRDHDTFLAYLPGGWQSGKSRLVIWLDPHGDAALPIQNYRTLAEETEVAMVAAPQLRNEMPLEEARSYCAALIQSVHSRWNPSEIYLAGFSGGAKIALLEGSANSLVSRVIYSGSGIRFDAIDRSKTFIGLAGKRDMNYTELVDLHLAMLSAGLTSVLLEWNGQHEWPAPAAMRLALVASLSDLPAGSWFTDSETEQLKRKQEQQLKAYYLKALGTQDLNWWQKELDLLHRKMVTDPDGILERVNGYLSLACYSFSKRMLAAHETGQLYPLLKIYQMADPLNADAACFMARYYWMLNQPEQASIHLWDARDKGFHRWEEVEPGLKALLTP